MKFLVSMMCSQSVTLTSEQIRLCEWIDEQRKRRIPRGRDLGRRDTSGRNIELEGHMGELALAVMLGVASDRATEKLFLDDLVYRGFTIDTKTSPKHYADLLVVPEKLHRQCDIYCLMIGAPESATYYCRGFCFKETVFQRERLQYYPTDKLNYVVLRKELIALPHLDRRLSARIAERSAQKSFSFLEPPLW